MNFLGAHKLVHDFGTALAKGIECKGDLFRPISHISFSFNKDKLIAAFQIFFAHMILYKTRKPEDVKKYFEVLQYIDIFIPNDELQKMRKITNQITRDNLLKSQEIKIEYQKIIDRYSYAIKNSYRLKDVENYYNSLLIYLKELEKKQNIELTYEFIEEYCIKSYNMANIKFNDNYIYFFLPFQTMRKYKESPEFRDEYIGYEKYIDTNQ